MPDHPRPHGGAVPTAALAGLVLVSLGLRPQLAGIGPLAGGIIADLGVSHAFVGLLTTVPILCMGVFAPAGPGLARRVGVRRAIAMAAAVVAIAGLLRALLPGEPTMLALTFVIGVATATSGPMLAMFVRGGLPDHRVAGTSSYAGGTTLGAAVAAAVAVPLAAALGGWRGSLAAISAASALGVLAWPVLTSGTRTAVSRTQSLEDARDGRLGLPVRRPVVWALGLLFGLQSAAFYGINAWLPSLYVERGWDPAAAAMLLSVSSIAGLAAIVVAPVASRRGAERRELLVAAAVAVIVGIGGVAVAPAPAWLWAVCLGGGLGMLFTVVLTLPTDVSADAREAGGASALMLLVGYLIAAVAPFTLGAVRDATGSFEASLWLLVAIATAMLPLIWALSPARLHPASRSAEAVRP